MRARARTCVCWRWQDKVKKSDAKWWWRWHEYYCSYWIFIAELQMQKKKHTEHRYTPKNGWMRKPNKLWSGAKWFEWTAKKIHMWVCFKCPRAQSSRYTEQKHISYLSILTATQVCVCVWMWKMSLGFESTQRREWVQKKVLNDADRKRRAMVGFETEAYILLSIAVIYFGLWFKLTFHRSNTKSY